MTLVELNNSALALQQSIAGLSDPIDTTIQAQLVLDAQTLATDLQGYVSPAVTEVIVDNPEGVGTGIWSNSSSASPYGAGSVYNDLGEVFTWGLTVNYPGNYEVYAWWTYHNNRAVSVPYRVNHDGGVTQINVNQHDISLGGQWNLLGTFTFSTGGSVEVSSENGQASADAVRILKTGTPPPTTEVIVDNPEGVGTGIWSNSSSASPYGAGSVYNDLGEVFTWGLTVNDPGYYEVYAWWTYHNNRAVSVPYRINHDEGVTQINVNQHDISLGGQWNLLGTFTFSTGGSVEVSSENGQASADAVRILKTDTPPLPPTTIQLQTNFPGAASWITQQNYGYKADNNSINPMGRITGAIGEAPVLAVDNPLVGPYGSNVWRYVGTGRDGWQVFDNKLDDGDFKGWNNTAFTQDNVEWARKPRWMVDDFQLFVDEMSLTGFVTGFDYASTTPIKRKNNYTLQPVPQAGYMISNHIAEPKKTIVMVCKLHPGEDQGMDMAEAITRTVIANPALMDGIDWYLYFGNPGSALYDHHRGSTDNFSVNANRVWGSESSIEVDAIIDDIALRTPVIDVFFDLHGFAIKNPVTTPYGYYEMLATPSANDLFLTKVNSVLPINLANWGTADTSGWAVNYIFDIYNPSLSILLESADALIGYPDVMTAHSVWAGAVTDAVQQLKQEGNL